MKTICNLSVQDAIDTISGRKYVYFRVGVLNEYKWCKVEFVTNEILASFYGAEVREEDGLFYVTCPTESDMW